MRIRIPALRLIHQSLFMQSSIYEEKTAKDIGLKRHFFKKSIGDVGQQFILFREYQGKPKAESQFCGSRESGQRRLDDF